MTMWSRIEELTRRVGELEARVPKAVVRTPPSPRCPCEDDDVCLMVKGSAAHPHGAAPVQRFPAFGPDHPDHDSRCTETYCVAADPKVRGMFRASDDGLSERSIRSLWMGPYQPAEQPRAAPIGALEAISDVIEGEPPRHVPWVDPDLSRASGLLLRTLDELDSDIHTEPITLQLRADIQDFLARARVATKEP